MTHIFTYGSLMFEEVWTRVVGGSYRHCPGTLTGFVRRCIAGEDYPAVLPGPIGARVDGTLYFDVAPEDLARLDLFEGSCYQRRSVQIRTDNNIHAADAYILKDGYHHLVEDREWDSVEFGARGIHRFLDTYGGFDD